MRTIGLTIVLTIIIPTGVSFPASAYNYEEATACADCHFSSGAHMPYVVDKWMQSKHAQSYGVYHGNTYCANCHAPFQADPNADHANNVPVPLDEWEAVTCGACHPPHDLRVEFGTPIGIYDVATGEYSPLLVEDSNALCTNCHTGWRHSQDSQGYGQVMFHKKEVRCIDCHMAKIPVAEGLADRAAHDFNVAANLPYSCGTITGGCHSNHKESWALKQIAKGRIHAEKKAH
jgi:hypothetical protein